MAIFKRCANCKQLYQGKYCKACANKLSKVWDNVTRSWDNAVPTHSRYFPEGWGRAVVGHPRGETFVKIFENEVMIWRTL